MQIASMTTRLRLPIGDIVIERRLFATIVR